MPGLDLAQHGDGIGLVIRRQMGIAEGGIQVGMAA